MESGRKVFESECSVCHGIDGGGGRGPNLRTPRLRHASDEKGLRAVISNGTSTGMPPAWQLTDEEVGGSNETPAFRGKTVRPRVLVHTKGVWDLICMSMYSQLPPAKTRGRVVKF